MKKLFIIFIAVAGFSVSSFAQVSANATSTATIITPIAITKEVDMNFGNVAVNSTAAGTVILAPAGTRTKSGGVSLPSTAGTVTAASFTVTGASGYVYAITLPSTDVILTRNTGTETMAANAFTSTPSATGTLTSGTSTLAVGATLNVSAAQAAGVYVSGTAFTVTVNYN